MELCITGKVALVTGGSRGIGRATALKLAGEGAQVAICGRDAAQLETTLGELRALGATAHGIVADVTAAGETERFVAEASEALGGVDLLVANVGGMSGRAFLSTTVEDWLATFELNLFHAVRAIRAAAPSMAARGGGSVVTLTYLGSERVFENYNVMGVAKAALEASVRYLASELGPQNIRVNAISAGPIKTLAASGIGGFSKILQVYRERAPLRRNVETAEVGETARFLLGPGGRGITGTVIPVDGGFNIMGI
jgi:enoyl-[acyl-carrier protein] reductase I